MYGDWRDKPVLNKRGTVVMYNCRTINPRTRLARTIRLVRSKAGFRDAVMVLVMAGFTNIIYAEKAVRDLK